MCSANCRKDTFQIPTSSVIFIKNIAEPGYNEIGLYDTSPMVRYSAVPINPSFLTIQLYFFDIQRTVHRDIFL